MADIAHAKTDQKLEEMEKRLSAIYSRAEKEIQKTADEYFSKFAKQDEEKQKLLEQGKLTEDEYKTWRQGKIMYGKRFTAMKEDVAKQLLNVNQTATAYINGELPEVYALNYNALADTVDGVGGYSFTLVDADTVKHLATADKSLLPFRELDHAKDIPWNMKKINSQVLQGVVQGESIPKIAKRIMNVQNMNKNAAIRSARTIVTGAENKGRQDSYARAEADGIILQKEWIATNDNRTRHAHSYLDGDIVDQDKPFETVLWLSKNKRMPDKIMFPGDPSAHPANVYNCRCTMAAVVNGFKKIRHPKTQSAQRKDGAFLKNVGIATSLIYFIKQKDAEKVGLTNSDMQEAALESMSKEQLIEIALYLLKNKRKNADIKKARKLFEKSTSGELIEYINFIGGV